jgi:hypothetical protein
MLETLFPVAAGFFALFALALTVIARNRSLRGAMVTVASLIMLLTVIAYVNSTRAMQAVPPTVAKVDAPTPNPLSSTCVRTGMVPACNCSGR